MAELIVNTGALLQNYRRYADAGQVIPVLKGNGYGLGAQPLRDLLAATAPADGQKLKIAVVTGAEGGFAAEEAEMAAKAGAKTVGLGPRILRCETAPLAVLSAVMTLTGNLE